MPDELHPLRSPDEGGPLTEHPDAEALPLSLVNPQLLRGVQTRQHGSALPRDDARIHVLCATAVSENIQVNEFWVGFSQSCEIHIRALETTSYYRRFNLSDGPKNKIILV